GCGESAKRESFSQGLLDYPHYTRPAEFRDLRAPDVLLSGNHAEIERWRRRKSIEKTLRRRPDLLRDHAISEAEDKDIEKRLKEFSSEIFPQVETRYNYESNSTKCRRSTITQ